MKLRLLSCVQRSSAFGTESEETETPITKVYILSEVAAPGAAMLTPILPSMSPRALSLALACALVALFIVSASADATITRPHHQHLLGREVRRLQSLRRLASSPSPPPPYETRWFDARLDNFNAHTQPATFRMRYLINTTNFDPSTGVIFFYTGNEGDIELFAANTGLVWECTHSCPVPPHHAHSLPLVRHEFQ